MYIITDDKADDADKIAFITSRKVFYEKFLLFCIVTLNLW